MIGAKILSNLMSVSFSSQNVPTTLIFAWEIRAGVSAHAQNAMESMTVRMEMTREDVKVDQILRHYTGMVVVTKICKLKVV